MDILNRIVDLMSKEEVRHFKLFTSRTSVSGERKDLKLFDYIRKQGDGYEEPRIFDKLYGGKSKNPFYRLKNRLLSDLNKSLILQHVDDDENIHMFHLLSLARYYRTRNSYSVALHYIKKAEKKAIQLENYELLDFIYTELIRLSHEIVSINPEDYIRKRKENREKLNLLREIDDILAAVIYRMNVSQNFSEKENPIFDLLQQTIDDFSENPAIKDNPKLRFTIYRAVTHLLLSRNDFPTLEEYLLKTFREFSEEGLFNKSTHDTKLGMLTYLVNTLYKNRKIDDSLKYCEKLREGMEEYNRMLYKKYLLFYYNGLIINYTITDIDKCISVLEGLVNDGIFNDMPFYECLMIANLSMAYYNNEQFQKALKTLVKVGIHDGYKTAAESLRLNIAMYELLLRLEINDFETIEKRLEKVRKEYEFLLSSPNYHFEFELMELVEKINNSIDFKRDEEIQNKARELFRNPQSTSSESNTFMNYQDWIGRKFRIQKP